MKSRRSFIQKSLAGVAAITLLPSIDAFSTPDSISNSGKRKDIKLRFALASDGHYGQPNTDSDKMFTDIITWLNEEHAASHLDFVLFNGDLVHDDPKLLSKVKTLYFDKLKTSFYAVPGNHDRATTQEWKAVFGYEDNYAFELNDIGFVTANTSNIKGELICPDNAFLKSKLDAFSNKNVVFVVLHIPPHKWLPQETFFVDCPDTINLLHQYPNIKAVFHGHEHSLDGKRYTKKMPHFFDGHFGGSWGTDYKGYRIVEVTMDNKIYTYQVNASKNPILNSTKI